MPAPPGSAQEVASCGLRVASCGWVPQGSLRFPFRFAFKVPRGSARFREGSATVFLRISLAGKVPQGSAKVPRGSAKVAGCELRVASGFRKVPRRFRKVPQWFS